MADITSANAVFLLTVPGALPVPVQLQGWAVDDAFDFAEVDTVETQMGVDGTYSGGIIFMPTISNLTFKADSPSIAVMDAWDAAQKIALAAFPAVGVLTLTSVGKSYALSTGFLTNKTPVAPGKKVLMPQKYRISWGTVISIPIGPAG